MAILTQNLWYDKRTKKFKNSRNLAIALTLILTASGVWITIDDNHKKVIEKTTLKASFDSVKSHLDSVKGNLNRSAELIEKLNDQLNPIISLAKARYPNLNSEEALANYRKDLIIIGNNNTMSFGQKGGVTTNSNNGIINQGGKGNTYNQQINPEVPQRHFTIGDSDWYKKNIPTKAKDFSISIYFNDVESLKYANEMSDYFKQKGLNMMMTPVGQIQGSYAKDKIGTVGVSLSSDSTWFSVTIFPLY